MTGVDQVVLAAETTTLTAGQANGITFSGTGERVVITASDGQQTLNGTDGNDRIHGDTDTNTTDTVNITQGGMDTLVFSGAANDFTVTGFTASGAGADRFDFRSVSAALENVNDAGIDVNVQDITQGTTEITGEILLFTTGGANQAAGVQLLFGLDITGPALNTLLGNGDNDMVLFIANEANTAVNVWRWDDAGTQGVQEAELSLLATLNGLTRQDLDSLQPNQFITV
jgi:hypothetical protein